MRLKSVELFGFKSFPDRTVIDFGEGITAILGPNGCGKSNVVDAIKWVLGEKSAKSLRGEEMLDVIFSGCASRAASGMAEVKLVFDNADQSIPVPYNEVCVGRRIYRSRESEYFINNNRCRLREIRNLFLDTGVGNSAYSVIEQGRVEALLHAKPADRRAVFEEAAGIAKIKLRRKETLSRMETTGQRLLRIGDRLAEKERQIRKVSAQAANARRHRRLTAERDALRALLYRRQYAEHSRLLDELRRRREALEGEIDREDGVLNGLAAEFSRLSREEADIAANRDAVMEDASKTQEELTAIMMGQSEAGNRVESLRAELARGNERRAELAARVERLAAQEREVAERLAEAEARSAVLEERFAGQDQSRLDLMRMAAEAENLVNALRLRAIDLNGKRQETHSAAARLEASEQSASGRMAEVDAKLERIASASAEAEAAMAGLEAEYRDAALAAEADRLQSEERAGESERSAKASRKATLEDLENSFDGAFEGVKSVLTAAREHNPSCRGVAGMAIDLMTVPRDLALAVETILGASAQDVVVETARDAQSAIEYLKQNRLGRATFLPLDRIQPRRRLAQNLKHIPGVVGEAVDLVDYDRRHNAVMEYLLAGILIVDSLDLARDLAGREARGVKIVTLDGDVVSPSGAMTGGHGKQRRAGLVQRKAELDALTRELAECERRLAEKSRRRAETADAIRTLGQEIHGFEQALAEAGRSEGQLRQNLAVRKSELERIAKDRAEAGAERNALARGGDGRRKELDALRRALADMAEEMARVEADVAAGVAEQRARRQALDDMGQEFAALSGERSAALAMLAELRGRLDELAAEKGGCVEEQSRPGLSSAETEAEIARQRERLAELRRREEELLRLRDERRAGAAELSERLAGVKSGIDGLRQRERESQAQTNRLREGLSLIDRQAAENEARLNAVVEKAREELRIEDLSAAPLPAGAEPDAAPLAFAAGEGLAPPVARTEERAEPEPEWAALGDAELQARIADISQKLKNIGTVYPEAIDELAELEAGFEFLRCDKEDLEEAMGDLRRLLDELSRESSVKFQETFAAVRANFQQMFTRLFGGGKADLILEEGLEPGADPLEAGIDVRAQPPGKEPKSISLLSGGEKALCAVALLFALFRSKPSPFCILDEVDGPLDESNIDRFMQALRDFTKETQFIIITHSQRTMGMTDEIWGVSQKVAGISSLNSLKFQVMEEMSRERPRGGRDAEVEPMEMTEAATA